jgi:uncharacterized coiled-coil protein SlyX
VGEVEFQRQEQLRQKMQEAVERLKKGEPLAGTVAEFFHLFETQLNDAPMLKEFVKRMVMENDATVKAWKESYERRVREQDLAIDGLEAEVAQLRSDLAELKDNFNLLAGKLVDQAERRLALVQRAVLVLETELNR